jgi:hypothetical protein
MEEHEENLENEIANEASVITSIVYIYQKSSKTKLQKRVERSYVNDVLGRVLNQCQGIIRGLCFFLPCLAIVM